MKLLHSKLTNCKVIKSPIFSNVQYYCGVYIATIRDRHIGKVNIKELLSAINELHPVLNGRYVHYILTQELLIIVDRHDYGLVEYLTEAQATNMPVQLLAPAASSRSVSPYILDDLTNVYTPDKKDKYTIVCILKKVGKINYANWSLAIEPNSECLVLVIDNQVMLECAKPIKLKEINNDVQEDEA